MAQKTKVEPVESVSNSTFDSEANRAGKRLARMPKRKIKIPVDPLNPKETMIQVVIQGYIYNIPRGKEVELPQPVIEILERSGKY